MMSCGSAPRALASCRLNAFQQTVALIKVTHDVVDGAGAPARRAARGAYAARSCLRFSEIRLRLLPVLRRAALRTRLSWEARLQCLHCSPLFSGATCASLSGSSGVLALTGAFRRPFRSRVFSGLVSVFCETSVPLFECPSLLPLRRAAS